MEFESLGIGLCPDGASQGGIIYEGDGSPHTYVNPGTNLDEMKQACADRTKELEPDAIGFGMRMVESGSENVQGRCVYYRGSVAGVLDCAGTGLRYINGAGQSSWESFKFTVPTSSPTSSPTTAGPEPLVANNGNMQCSGGWTSDSESGFCWKIVDETGTTSYATAKATCSSAGGWLPETRTRALLLKMGEFTGPMVGFGNPWWVGASNVGKGSATMHWESDDSMLTDTQMAFFTSGGVGNNRNAMMLMSDYYLNDNPDDGTQYVGKILCQKNMD